MTPIALPTTASSKRPMRSLRMRRRQRNTSPSGACSWTARVEQLLVLSFQRSSSWRSSRTCIWGWIWLRSSASEMTSPACISWPARRRRPPQRTPPPCIISGRVEPSWQPPRSRLHAPAPDAEDAWQRQYDVTRDLCIGAAEAACLSTEFAETERWAAEVLQHASRLLEKIRVQEVRIQAYMAQSRLPEAIALALEVLQLLGIEFLQPLMSHKCSRLCSRCTRLWPGNHARICLAVASHDRS